MKKIILMALIIILLTGCSSSEPDYLSFEPDITTQQNIRVVIKDAYCEDYSILLRNHSYISNIGITSSRPVQRSRYVIEIEYGETTFYEIVNEEVYENYKDLIGTEVMATLEINTFRNGAVSYDILFIQK